MFSFAFVNEYFLNDMLIVCQYGPVNFLMREDRWKMFLPVFLFRSLHLFLCLSAQRGGETIGDACQIMRVESEKFKKYSKFNYPAVDDPRSFEIVRAANASVEK